jgi:hypothetical protein
MDVYPRSSALSFKGRNFTMDRLPSKKSYCLTEEVLTVESRITTWVVAPYSHVALSVKRVITITAAMMLCGLLEFLGNPKH